MALKVLMLRREIEQREAELAALHEQDAGFETREAELESAIAEVETEEQRSAVTAEIDSFEAERSQHSDAVGALETKIAELRENLAAEEAKSPKIQKPEAPAQNERSVQTMHTNINIRSLPHGQRAFDAFPMEWREATIKREDVRTFLADLRSFKGQQRSVSGADLLVPEILLEIIAENRYRYSKLLNRVRYRNIRGKGKQPVAGTRQPGIWVGARARLNEINLVFNSVTVDDYKNAAVVVVNNTDLEDSDMNLASFIVEEISESLGLSDDMAILYGKGSAYNMPLGVVTRLAQTSAPNPYPVDAPAWVDLHTTNIITINGPSLTGAGFWEALNTASGNTFTKYARGALSWAMNSKTYNYLKGKAIATSVTGEWVSLIGGSLPIISGQIDVLEFMPDYDIVGGYFDLYLWGQRRGMTIGLDETGLANRIDDTTVFFGKERADGQPVIPGSFVAMNIYNQSPSTEILFPTDDANTVSGILMPATASVGTGGTLTLPTVLLPFGVESAITWESSTTAKATVSSAGVITAGATTGSTTITATAGGKTASCVVTITA